MLEPEDIKARTRNLQQTNTNGFKLKSIDAAQRVEAERIIEAWGPGGRDYSPTANYHAQLRELIARFRVRFGAAGRSYS